MKTFVYDVESTPNFFSVIFVNIKTHIPIEKILKRIEYNNNVPLRELFSEKDFERHEFVIHTSRCNLGRLVKFLQTKCYLIGFNNKNYDNYLIKFLLMNFTRYSSMLKRSGKYQVIERITNTLYQLSNKIIHLKTNWWNDDEQLKDIHYYNAPFISIDLSSMGLETIERKALKQIAVNLRYPRIQDMPFDYIHFVDITEIGIFLDYNLNDVLITLMFFNEIKDLLKLRNDIAIKYGYKDTKYNFESILNANKSKLGELLGTKLYSKATGKKEKEFKNERTHRDYIYLDNCVKKNIIQFKDDKLSSFLNNEICNTVISDTKAQYEFNLKYKSIDVNFKLGGLHSKDKGAIYRQTDEYYIIDADVSSYYPRIITNLKIKPLHLSHVFYQMVESVISDRIKAKLNGDKVEADTFKIVLNSWLYGKMGYQGSWTYDKEAEMGVTINGQLLLIMLIERLFEIGVKPISVNTDGITTKVYKNKVDEYYKVCKQWMDETSFELEFVYYKLYVRRDVNNYMAIYEKNGKDEIKTKGIFTENKPYYKGYGLPILGKSLSDYYYKQVPIEETIHNCTNIYSFCETQKIGNSFEFELYSKGKVETLQKDIRFYVSENGKFLFKRGGKRGNLNAICKNNKVTLFNDFIYHKDFKAYEVYYEYFIKSAYAEIDRINNKKPRSVERYLKYKRHTKKRAKESAKNDNLKLKF